MSVIQYHGLLLAVFLLEFKRFLFMEIFGFYEIIMFST